MITKLIALCFALILSSNIAFADKIWIRPIKKNVIFRSFPLIKDSYVQTKGKSNGDIIIGKDTLHTNDLRYADYNQRVETELDSVDYRNINSMITIHDDSLFIFDFEKVNGKGCFDLYIYKDTVFIYRDSLNYGEKDTVDFNSSEASLIVLVPREQKLVKYIQIKEIGRTRTETPIIPDVPTPVPDKDYTIFIIIGTGIFIVVLLSIYIKKNKAKREDVLQNIKSNNEDELKNEFKKALEDLDNKRKSIEKSFKKQLEDKQRNKIIENIESLVNELKDLTNENYNAIPQDIIKEIISEIEKIKIDKKHVALAHIIENKKQKIEQLINCIIETRAVNSPIDNVLSLTANDEVEKIDCEDIRAEEQKSETTNKGNTSTEQTELIEHIKDNSTEQTETPKKTELEVELENKVRKLELLLSEKENNIQEERQKLEEEKNKRDDIIKKKVEAIETDYKKKLLKRESEAEEKINKANKKAEKAEEKSRTISDELNAQFDKERKRVQQEKEKLNSELNKAKTDLNETSTKLSQTSEELRQATKRIENLTIETTSFKQHITGVESSRPYCNGIVGLINLVNEIQVSANTLLESDIEDKYFIYKPMALYMDKLNKIDLQKFYSDVEIISKTGFAIKGTPLASYDQTKSNSELEELTKMYFFTNYLKTYVDAITVLNESFAGLHYLVDDINTSEVAVFNEYRQKLEIMTRKIGISVLSVKVFDSVGVNTDLLATEIEAGIEKHGAILEIENCKVNLIGGTPSNERINVKVQK